MPDNKNDRRHQDNLDPETRSEIGRKGGEAVSQDREHMAEIGRKGGQQSGGGNKGSGNKGGQGR